MFTCNGSEPKDILKGLLKLQEYLYLKDDSDMATHAQMTKALEDVIQYMVMLDKLDPTNNINIITTRGAGKMLWSMLLAQQFEKDSLIKELKLAKDIKPLASYEAAYIVSERTPESAHNWYPWMTDIYDAGLIVAKLIKEEEQ